MSAIIFFMLYFIGILNHVFLDELIAIKNVKIDTIQF